MASSTRNEEGGELFDADALAQILFGSLHLAERQRVFLALSGGVDSHALLHALVELSRRERLRVYALHVNHGLHPRASEWEAYCRELCARYEVPIDTRRLALADAGGGGSEARARTARYAWFETRLDENDVLLTAHHRDDQVETVLLRLLRGTGIAGAAGMSRRRRLGRGWLVRPLLGFGRADLARYARHHDLAWVEDPSNVDTRVDRNYLRHCVLPQLTRQWPSAPTQIARFAEHAAEAQCILEAAACRDLDKVASADVPRSWVGGQCLQIADLARLDGRRLRNLLRHWMRRAGLRAPTTKRLDEIVNRMIQDPRAPGAIMAWSGNELRRYRGWLYAMRAAPVPDVSHEWSWDARAALELPVIQSCLQADRTVGHGLALERLTLPLTVRWRRGGEVCRLCGHAHHRKLKKLFQEKRIPPWQRKRIPLVYSGERLAAVVGHWYCEPFCARPGEPAVELSLRPDTEQS